MVLLGVHVVPPGGGLAWPGARRPARTRGVRLLWPNCPQDQEAIGGSKVSVPKGTLAACGPLARPGLTRSPSDPKVLFAATMLTQNVPFVAHPPEWAPRGRQGRVCPDASRKVGPALGASP